MVNGNLPLLHTSPSTQMEDINAYEFEQFRLPERRGVASTPPLIYSSTPTTLRTPPTPATPQTYYIHPTPSTSEQYNSNEDVIQRTRQQLSELRQRPLLSRINEIFMYIDQLGNYTNANWFSSLTKRKYQIFYSQLRELWIYRGELPSQIKQIICPLGDPFIDSAPIFAKPYDQITDEEMCDACLNVIENIIMTSFDVEYRKIGCLHVLTALTVICQSAREQYRYLFESIV
jgi:hypothetical protein